MRYAVVGVGRQGLSAVYDLVKNCEASQVLALDVRFADPAILQQVQRQLDDLLGNESPVVRLQAADLADQAALERLSESLRGFDCILSALPYRFNEAMSRVAIAAGVPTCDMGGNPEMVDRQKVLAVERNHIVVPECGLAPGICNVFIKHLHQHHGATIVEAYCGGLPREKPDPAVNPLQYKLLFSPQGLISEYMGQCPILKDGQISYVAALSGLERYDDAHEAFYTTNNSPRILEYFAALGIRACRYKTVRYRGHLAKINVLRSLGFLQSPDGTDPDLASRLAASEALRFDRTREEDKVMLAVRGSADGTHDTTIELVDFMDPATRFTAMERTTAWGTTIVAFALASGQSQPANFATPEQFIDTDWFLEQLKRRTDRISIS